MKKIIAIVLMLCLIIPTCFAETSFHEDIVNIIIKNNPDIELILDSSRTLDYFVNGNTMWVFQDIDRSGSEIKTNYTITIREFYGNKTNDYYYTTTSSLTKIISAMQAAAKELSKTAKYKFEISFRQYIIFNDKEHVSKGISAYNTWNDDPWIEIGSNSAFSYYCSVITTFDDFYRYISKYCGTI